MPRQKLLGLLILFGIFSAEANAEMRYVAEARHGKLWRVSAVVLGAVTIADVQSSMGRPEANGFLRSVDGRFGSRGVALKGVAVGAALGAQWLMLRRNPNAAKYAAVTNFAAASLTGAAVVHNHMLK
jgi:hypothetical protein